jgi:hypothetical protein
MTVVKSNSNSKPNYSLFHNNEITIINTNIIKNTPKILRINLKSIFLVKKIEGYIKKCRIIKKKNLIA